jgi:hypothetical protein
MYLIKKESTAGKNVAGVHGKHSKGLNKAHKVQRCSAITDATETDYLTKVFRSIDQRNERRAKRK